MPVGGSWGLQRWAAAIRQTPVVVSGVLPSYDGVEIIGGGSYGGRDKR